ncbi:hypothetical protein AAFN88_17825 [Pelagibius sp. CAU 1746]|uniref:hypothetical protein n=1 Tax=Pelagibius sp. CAU 1746 TaxID=3140370 RepID=UPI00325ABDD8
MPEYRVVFIKSVDPGDEMSEDVSTLIGLNATTRDAAEAEAFALRRPEDAAGFKLLRDNHYEGPKLWFDL